SNIRFDLPDGRLRSERRVLRLRRDTETRLTYKDPSQNEQGVLSRREIEFIVEDFDKARQFLEALGYQSIFYYEKYRTTYILESTNSLLELRQQAVGLQSCHIMLDELPYGNFVEIEGETLESIQAAASALDLKWDTAIGKSYSALFDQAHTILNFSFQDLSFTNFARIQVTTAQLGIQAADE
ncbi:MAG TPA: class IV adenylate cyclase, partial [Anaerolineales bacterium]|nr:class IV adenylate cyclase [Anaerolineales bacterium]